MMSRMMSWLSAALDQRVAKHSVPAHLIGPSIFRVLSGLTILSEILILYGQRHFLFGLDGVFPYSDHASYSNQLSLFALATTNTAFEVVYHAIILVVLAWTLGIATGWLTPCVAFCWSSLMDRGPGIWDGGDNLITLLLIYACFADVGAHFSFRSRPGSRGVQRSPALGIMHNTALKAFAVQVCIVYFVAGVLKARGETWLDGAALYNSVADKEFGWPGAAEFLFEHRLLLSIVGPCTIFFQISFPFFFFLNEKTRRIILGVAIAFHVGIAIVLGLISFAAFFIAAELALLEDREYRAAVRWARGVGDRVARAFRMPTIGARDGVVVRAGARYEQEG